MTSAPYPSPQGEPSAGDHDPSGVLDMLHEPRRPLFAKRARDAATTKVSSAGRAGA